MMRRNRAEKVSGGGVVQLRYLSARILGFDLALLEECEGLLVKFVLSTGVPTTLEVFICCSESAASPTGYRCSTPVGYRRATSR